jgi:phage terminase large subunit
VIFIYRPLGAARELFRRRDPEVILSGPAGTGKSRGVLEKVHACAEKYPGSRLLIVRKTRASLTNTGLVTYEELVLPPGNAQINYQGAQYPNGSVITFGGLDKASKIMSSEYDIVYVQEATELTEDDWEKLTTRLRWGKLPYQQILADCNPAQPTHWLKRRADAGRCLMLESRHEDNPRMWDRATNDWTAYGRSYITTLDALSGARYMRLRKGIWAAAEGMVYEDYDPAVHLIDRFDIPPQWPRAWVVDFGFTNPFVCQMWAHDPDGRMYRYREFYRTQRLVEDHCADIRAVCKRENEPIPVVIICDHDAEDRATFAKHMGLATYGAYKAISPGIQAVQNRLKVAGDGKARLFLLRDSLVERDESLYARKLPVCTEDEIEAYCWPHNNSGKSGEVPVKENDHGMDCLRYIVAHGDKLAHDPANEKTVQVLNPVGVYQISPV